MTDSTWTATATINLSALAANARAARSRTDADIMAIVKADAYGHGLVPAARTLLEAGVDALGVAQLEEALTLRAALGPGPRIMTWIFAPGASLERALGADLEISVGSSWSYAEVRMAAMQLGVPAKIHLEFDTGMARGGFPMAEVDNALADAAAGVREGTVDVVGIWSHLARADEPDFPLTNHQVALMEDIRARAARAGLDPQTHLAASGGLWWHESSHFDMVRPGIVLYGLSPNPQVATARDLGLTPVMTLESRLILVRDVPAGTPVSYGHTAQTSENGRIGVIPLGYADGIPRAASSAGPVSVGGERSAVLGRVCMDQIVVPVPAGAEAGDLAVLFGSDPSVPTADDWAAIAGTIGYEITTRIGPRVPRRYVKD